MIWSLFTADHINKGRNEKYIFPFTAPIELCEVQDF